MVIYPAIDIYEGKAVRLYKGNYDEMTIYSNHPIDIARKFVEEGATHIHMVDLQGARSGDTPNMDAVKEITKHTDLFSEIGGGIRDMGRAEAYLDSGVNRIILGTAAVENPEFLNQAVSSFGEQVAVGVDIRDGFVAIKGWEEKTKLEAFDFCLRMQDIGVKTIICTDISRDGALKGTNHQLYKELSEKLDLNIIASGGVSTIEDVENLTKLNIHGAIIGKAYYE